MLNVCLGKLSCHLTNPHGLVYRFKTDAWYWFPIFSVGNFHHKKCGTITRYWTQYQAHKLECDSILQPNDQKRLHHQWLNFGTGTSQQHNLWPNLWWRHLCGYLHIILRPSSITLPPRNTGPLPPTKLWTGERNGLLHTSTLHILSVTERR